MADEIKSSVDVYYGEQLIGIVSHGETGDIDCKGREMLEDIRIKVPHDMKAVKYQDKRFIINKNGKHTMYPDEGYVMGAAILEVEVPSDNIWLGKFDPDYPYRVGSIVSQNNMVYICIVKPTDNQPPTDTTYWELLSGKIQDEKIVDIITYGKLEFEPDEGYVAVRKLIANVANVTTDATATEEDVVYGKTFWAGGESKAGTMKMVDSSTFKSLVLEKIAEGELEIRYYADKNAYILNNKGQTRPGTIGTILEPKFIADNIASGVTLFGLEGKYAPKFDGTINIESSLTTISGSYLIDEQKAYDLLLAYGKVKTFNVNFSAGSSGSGMGDSIDFTSMTFDGDYGFIKYNDKAAFAMNGGFAEYNNNYGDGNGARVNFEEGTECRKEFKELFLSIADEYVEKTIKSFTFAQNSNWYSIPIVRDFEEGMTWGDFIESEYNATQTDTTSTISVEGQFIANGNYVSYKGTGKSGTSGTYELNVYDGDRDRVLLSNEISFPTYYSTSSTVGGGN